jgi:hypothetical protein
VNPTVVLVVIVLVPNPRLKSSTPLGRNNVERPSAGALVKAVEMPLAEVGGVVSVVVEHVGYCLLFGVEPILVAGNRAVGIQSREHRSTEGTAQGKSTYRAVEVGAFGLGQYVDVRGIYIGVTIAAQRLCAMLIAEDPYDVWSVVSHVFLP